MSGELASFDVRAYLNMRGEVRQEALGLRYGWRQSDRFRFGEDKTGDQVQHLYLEPERARWRAG